ncbi:MAG: NFACT family protein [Lachnospiraceae bacterium]|nr:NFACT family protein [Lachnospiraceae bacterium]
MAFDGTMVSALVKELSNKLTGGRINKIQQPEKDELVLTIKTSYKDGDKTIRGNDKLVLSVSPSLPLVYLTDEAKPAPMTAPTFCMVIRKYMSNAQITSIEQPDFERVIRITTEHFNEMGDKENISLVVELMGKHSNIILVNNDEKVIDSIKHISALTSSVREVLPGRDYYIPNTMDKTNPLTVDYEAFKAIMLKAHTTPEKAIYTSFTGISPLVANEVLYRAKASGFISFEEMDEYVKFSVFNELEKYLKEIDNGTYKPQILYVNKAPKEYSTSCLTSYIESDNDTFTEEFSDVSTMLTKFYREKELYVRIREKSASLRQVVHSAVERTSKKLNIQNKQLKSTENREKFKHYGELINTYGYLDNPDKTCLICTDYETGEEVKIPLDENKTVAENANHYFDRYNKLKRTFDAMQVQIKETTDALTYLESVSNALDIATSAEDLNDIKTELSTTGYIKKSGLKKGEKRPKKSKPMHYISSDGFDILIGKNNLQNDELTFKIASNKDLWFHAKGAAGSHVILRTNGLSMDEIPDRAFEEAAAAAAYYSKLKTAPKAEIDYVEKKQIKKPNAANPGFVIYYTNYSMIVTPGIDNLKNGDSL